MPRQNERAQMLFGLYPDKKKAYNLNQQLRGIYNNNNDKYIAMTKLATLTAQFTNHFIQDLKKLTMRNLL